jgi:hypothetical protein
MKSNMVHAALATVVLGLVVITLNLSASARDVVLPAGTLLQCTLSEPNFSSATADVGDPVLCHLRGQTEFGQQAFPRGSYLVGHLESAKEPGHFWGKGNLKLQFDRIGLPGGDLPLEAKIIATRGYKVDKQGRIDGKGHLKRDIVEWMIPPLWPWKVIMLPARGPRPTLKGETVLSMRLMDDVDIPQVAQTYGPSWHFFGRYQNDSLHDGHSNMQMQLSIRPSSFVSSGDNNNGLDNDSAQLQSASQSVPQPSYASLVTRTPPMQSSMTQSSMTQPILTPAGVGPGMPVFVLTTGTVLSVSGYGYTDTRITYSLVGGGTGVISTNDVDWNATTQLNAQRGVRVTLHNTHATAGTPGF